VYGEFVPDTSKYGICNRFCPVCCKCCTDIPPGATKEHDGTASLTGKMKTKVADEDAPKTEGSSSPEMKTNPMSMAGKSSLT
jgi:hypothetical protein